MYQSIMFDHKVVAFGITNAIILSWVASISSTNVATYEQGGINR